MLKALLFDLDGTLANTDPIHFQTWKDLLQGYGLDIDPEFYQANFSGRRNQEIISDLLPQLSPEDSNQLSLQKEADFRVRAEMLLTPTEGLLDVLEWMERQYLKRAIVTNAPTENAAFMLRVLNLKETFETVILGDELPVGKPDPLPYQMALEQLEITPEEAIVFEDSASGIRSAVGAGIMTIGVASTHSHAELYGLGCKLVINDFSDQQLWELLGDRVAPAPV
ncbi:HAD family hydrolase [Egbenema bharatensis]|uniref:HAD family hydrolase n=1 Tax=Egbenema bharatensis TaxID=3463334 RepID=UPI003A874EB9